MPKRKNDDFEALFKRIFKKGKSSAPKWGKKTAAKAPFATFTQPIRAALAQPFHCDLRRLNCTTQ